MVETHWEDLRGRELRYRDHAWSLTGDVDVREDGALLGVDARQVDDVKGRTATLYFGLQNPPGSLNPGNVGEHFDRLERVDGDHHLVVRTAGRSYRYELHRLAYE